MADEEELEEHRVGGPPPVLVDNEILQDLVRRYFKPLEALFRARGLSPERARDLVQETFLRACKGASTYRGASSHATWLYAIAENVLKNFRRDVNTHKRRGIDVSLEESLESDQHFFKKSVYDIGTATGPLDALLAREEGRKVHEALEELPPQMKECLRLRLQGMKYREIAIVMRISIDTVKAHLFQARQRLKARLGDYFSVVAPSGPDDD